MREGPDIVIQKVSELVEDAENELGFARGMVTKAVVVAHVVDQSGDRHLHIIRDTDIKDWEIKGMFAEVLSDLQAFALMDVLDEGDEV